MESVARRLQMEGGPGAERSAGSWGAAGGGSRAGSRSGSRSPSRANTRREGHVSAAAASARTLGRAGVPERLPSPEDVTSVR